MTAEYNPCSAAELHTNGVFIRLLGTQDSFIILQETNSVTILLLNFLQQQTTKINSF